MDNLEQKRLGLRIKSVRILSGLNQEEFAKACDFNPTSLRNWEFGRVAPRKEAIDRLIEAFKNFSIFVDREWIFFGQGQGPVFTCEKPRLDDAHQWKNEIASFKSACAAIGENPLTLRLEDDEMAPSFCKDDWVGAVAKSLSGLLKHPKNTEIFSRPMLVKWEDNSTKLRHIFFDGQTCFSKSSNGHQLVKIVGDVVGVVMVHISSGFMAE